MLKVDHEIIQRQMAHSFGDKIRCYYDNSQMLTERKDFMVTLCDALVKQDLTTYKSDRVSKVLLPQPFEVRLR